MSGRHVTLSSAFADYQTPEPFLDLVRQVGPIVLDPATTAANPTRAQYIYTPPSSPFDPSVCGLTGSWAVDGLVWCNPRYGRFLRGPIKPREPVFKVDEEKRRVLVGYGTGWVRKMTEHRGEGLYLVPARPDTEWWRELYAWCDWTLFWASPLPRRKRGEPKPKSDAIGSRIQFRDPRTGAIARGSNLPSSVFYRGPRADAFCSVFEPHGTLAPGRDTLQTLLRLHYGSS